MINKPSHRLIPFWLISSIILLSLSCDPVVKANIAMKGYRVVQFQNKDLIKFYYIARKRHLGKYIIEKMVWEKKMNRVWSRKLYINGKLDYFDTLRGRHFNDYRHHSNIQFPYYDMLGGITDIKLSIIWIQFYFYFTNYKKPDIITPKLTPNDFFVRHRNLYYIINN